MSPHVRETGVLFDQVLLWAPPRAVVKILSDAAFVRLRAGFSERLK